MLDLNYTQHAETRLRQRGFRKEDVAVILSVATKLSGDAFFLSDQDAQREISKRKREIQQLERLPGAEMIVEGDTLVTAYHRTRKPDSQKRRRTEN